MDDKTIAQAIHLAEAHWSYIRKLLTTHNVAELEISHIKFHYISAFIHGYKHGQNTRPIYVSQLK